MQELDEHAAEAVELARTEARHRRAVVAATFLLAGLVLVGVGALVLIGGHARRVVRPGPSSGQRASSGVASSSVRASSALPSMFCGYSRFEGLRRAVRPGEISCLSADGSTFLAGPRVNGGENPAKLHAGTITWVRWTDGLAVGRGYLWENTCQPDCSIGKYGAYPASIRASRVRHGEFTRLVISASGIPQSGDTATLTYNLDLKIGQWLGVHAVGQPPPPRV